MVFLDWISAETGLWVRFTDSHAERLAASALLHGTLKGLTPAQAPQLVLPSCGLNVTKEPGTLVIGLEDSNKEH